jgi:peptidoglycan-associated lipoprotein
MPIRFTPAARFAAAALLAGSVAASLSACASKPKPVPVPEAPPPPMTPPPPPADTFAPPPPQPVTTGQIRPGSQQDFVVNVGDRVYFDYNAYEVKPEGRGVLDAQAAWLNRYPSVKVRIEGNCDERGTREYNLALGARRAGSVAQYLASRGVSSSRISTVSYGKERPIDSGTGEEAWAKNRNAHTDITEGAR